VWPTPDSFVTQFLRLRLHSRSGTDTTHWSYAAACRRRPPSRRRILILRRQTSFPPRPPARRHCPSGPEQYFLFPARLVPGHQRVHQSDSLDHQPLPPLKFSGSASACASADAPRVLWQTTCSKIAISRSPSVLPSRNFRSVAFVAAEENDIGLADLPSAAVRTGTWTHSSNEISASSRTLTTASPRWPIACWK
jgi:hypothetical protein